MTCSPRTDRGIFDGADEFEIAAIGGDEQTPKIADAVDGVSEGSELEFVRAVPVFHRPMVLEKGNVIRRGFDPQNAAEFVVHLAGCGTHVVANTGCRECEC
jgi:hypothetical protein